MLSRDGYRGLSIQEVLAEARATSGSLYHHFPGGKEELAAAAILDAGRVMQDTLRRGIATVGVRGAVEAKFQRSGEAMATTDWTLGCPVGTPAADGVVVSEVVADAVRESLDGLIDAIADGLVGEGAGPEAARESAAWILAAYEGAVLLARSQRSTAVLDASARRVEAEIERLLTAD